MTNKNVTFKDYESFKNQSEVINGCTQSFLNFKYKGDVEKFLEDNKTNDGCFNCDDCTYCENSVDCMSCTHCVGCNDSTHCKHSEHLRYKHNWAYCSHNHDDEKLDDIPF